MVGIGFFAPLPLAMMMPFMAGQSMLMGDAFGKSFQYGKRKISAMSNEEFNKLTPEMLGKQIVTDYTAIIPSLEQAVRSSSEFQSMIIQEMGVILKNIPNEILKFLGLDPIEGDGTVDGLLHVTIAQVKSWSNIKLKNIRENKIELYTTLSQSYIITEYNKRGLTPTIEPIPAPPPLEVPPDVPKIDDVVILNHTWFRRFAQGWAAEVQGNPNDWRLYSNLKPGVGQWHQILNGSAVQMHKAGNASWPEQGYAQFKGNQAKNTFWVLRSVVPAKFKLE